MPWDGVPLLPQKLGQLSSTHRLINFHYHVSWNAPKVFIGSQVCGSGWLVHGNDLQMQEKAPLTLC